MSAPLKSTKEVSKEKNYDLADFARADEMRCRQTKGRF